MTDTAPLRTRRHRGSAADLCRANGWGPGTRLVGDEGYGPTVIEITAIGEARLLAKCLGHNGVAHRPHESTWVLDARDWRVATDDEIPAPLELGQRVRFTYNDQTEEGRIASEPDTHGAYRVQVDDERWFLIRGEGLTPLD